MTQWGDAKRGIFEDIIVYASVIVADLGYDLFINFMHSVGLRAIAHPYDFGYEQLFLLFSFGLLLARKIYHAQFYFKSINLPEFGK